ncbi:ATP-dependent DNA helicase DDX11 isoform X2 [Diorhabda sublineata]|uniref:ATP-dependent DNA helicase DDX11 isoform X2 n=1 Tax=Diorhabda sublineata TaxID=1163346 RepID=UPI0024E07E6B|nr:ATP-dependent DNA helicase DDX11 isoform X2 [Diorhabda sublineata]
MEEKKLIPPEEFDFPFTPYDIQVKFMKSLYYTLENGKLGIFESPTGTGKSLNIICGAIRWLKDRQHFEKENLIETLTKLIKEKDILSKDTNDWLSSQSKEIEMNYKINALKLKESKIIEYENKIKQIKKFKNTKLNKPKFFIKMKNIENVEQFLEHEDDIDDDDILPKESISENKEGISDDETSNTYEPIKIYICSRTHSQLAQFVGEIVKTSFKSNIRVVSLASRQTFCINPDVSKLKNMALINERCLDLQKKTPKPKTDADGKVTKKLKVSTSYCPFFKQSAIEELSNYALTEVQDVEDLISSGKELNACPYYGSRKAAEDAEVVLIPYNTLLHKATREANGIKLENNIVIIDEAHNILEALAQMYNSDLSYAQIYHASHQMKAYKKKFSTRFSAKNLLMINQLIFVINQLLQALEKCCTENGTRISTLENFVLETHIDNYNMFKLTKFCKECRLAQKIRSFAMKYPVEEAVKEKKGIDGVREFLATIQSKKGPEKIKKPEEPPEPKTVVPPISNPLLAVISFLECLTYSYEDGRILLRKSKNKLECKFQFLLLNPSANFSDIVKKARSIIVAGGTMQPISEFRDRLFINAGADPDRILEFSCDHIVPPDHILPIIVTKGQKNENLLFNFENRMLMGNSVKGILLETCRLVIGGIVVFFPSYNYENWIWGQVEKINFGRKVFREPQTSGQVDAVLEKYAEAINSPGSKGALLFSVVGGKLSEGLNFSDDLGRCVIVVGLPYSNITAADLKEKMNYLDKIEGQGAGQKYYENQCMKAVNQCIGRAVRHINDYATVLLLDERYSRATVKTALPNWIKKSLKISNYEETFIAVKKFFEERKKKG